MPETLQFLLFVGFAALMFLLRLDARRFGAAEWDDQSGGWRANAPRLTWYGAGLALGLLAFALHPRPVTDLNLSLSPDRGEALLWGLVYGAGGVVAAFALAFLRDGGIHFPSPSRYPGGIVAAIGTAFFDEFVFRGILLGLLLSLDLPGWAAVVGAAVIYAGAIRAVAGGRGLFMLVIAFAIGLVGGALVLLTFGIAAALVGHAITRFAIFLTLDPVRLRATPLEAPATTATISRQPYIIPPRRAGRGDDDDGRGGFGPVRPT